MKPPDSATEAIVQALEEIKPDILKDPRSLAVCLARLEPPKSAAKPPRADEVARFVQALGRGNISPASWYMIVMEAANAGYYLPCNVDVMAQIAGEAATRIRRPRRSSAWKRSHVAGACAALYLDLTRRLPKILNYRQLGHDNDYSRLVKVAFDRAGLPGWGSAAQDAASELKHAVQYKKKP